MTTIIQFPDEPEISELRRYFEGWKPPSNEEWFKQSCSQVLPAIRLAFMTVHKTCAEVREITRVMKDEGALDELLEMFERTSRPLFTPRGAMRSRKAKTYREWRGPRGNQHMTIRDRIRLRYGFLKLRALCWLLLRLRKHGGTRPIDRQTKSP